MKRAKPETIRAANALAQMAGSAPTSQDVLPYAAPPAYYQQPPQVIYQQIITVQQTSKTWKGMLAIGVIILMMGVVLAIIAMNSKGAELYGVFSVLALFIGLVVTIIAKIGAWWNHG